MAVAQVLPWSLTVTVVLITTIGNLGGATHFTPSTSDQPTIATGILPPWVPSASLANPLSPVTDFNGRVASSTFALKATTMTVSVSAYPNPVDVDQSATIQAIVSGGSGPYSYAWGGTAPPGCKVPSGSTFWFLCKPTSNVGSPFTMTVTVTDTTGATVLGSLTLPVDPALVVSPTASPNPVHAGQTTTITANPSGGSGSYVAYLWTGTLPGCPFPSVTTTPVFSCRVAICTPPRTIGYNVTVFVTDSNVNKVPSTVQVGVLPPVGAPTCSWAAKFSESGLPSGATWFVNITSGPSLSSNGTTATTSLTNGSYQYSVGVSLVKKVAYSAPAGTFVMNGTPVTVSLAFGTVHPVTFAEKGLPSGTLWWVNVTAEPGRNSTGTTLKFWELSGRYTYAVGSANPQYAAKGGTFVVHKGGVSKTVRFALVSNDATLPAGKSV